MKKTATRSLDTSPLFRQVLDDLRQRITSREFSPGARIPSIRELCETHRVSPITVRRALSELVNEGLLRGAQGRGMFVIDRKEPAAGASGLIGLIIPESTEASRFQSGIRRGVESGVASAIPLLVGYSDLDPWREVDLLADMGRHRADGVLIVATTGVREASADQRMRDLIAGGTHVVFIDRRPTGIEADLVTSDNEPAGRLAGEHLLARGHRRIACIWAHECATFSDRRRGLEAAMLAQGCKPDPQYARGGWDPSGGHEACGYLRTLELFHLPKPPTAIFAGNDGMAVGAMRALHFLGRSVPGDVSVIGVDAIVPNDPPLTSIRQDVVGMGLWAVEQLRRRIAGDTSPATVHLLPTELIEGRTVGAARA